MSRWLDYDPKTQKYTERIECMDKCKHMYNEACCNDASEMLAEYPDDEYCNDQCPFFEKEDGIICGNPEV